MTLTCKTNRDFFTHCLSCVKRKTNVLLIEKLLVRRQLAEFQNELDALTEKRDDAQRDYSELTEKKQEQTRMRLTDAIFARMVVDIRSMLDVMPLELKADIDGDFLAVIAEQPNEILKCAMYLFLGCLDGATQFAQSCGGGGTSSDLPWGRNQDEDDRRFAYRCMMQAHKMLKPAQPKPSRSRDSTTKCKNFDLDSPTNFWGSRLNGGLGMGLHKPSAPPQSGIKTRKR